MKGYFRIEAGSAPIAFWLHQHLIVGESGLMRQSRGRALGVVSVNRADRRSWHTAHHWFEIFGGPSDIEPGSNRIDYACASISNRSLRTVYRICSSSARSSFSGAIDGRPLAEYSSLNFADSPCNTSSVILRIARNGCLSGTRSSGER